MQKQAAWQFSNSHQFKKFSNSLILDKKNLEAKFFASKATKVERSQFLLIQKISNSEWDEARDGASGGLSHPPRSHRHRNRRLTVNQRSRRTASRMTYIAAPALCR